jgi:cytochrome c553
MIGAALAIGFACANAQTPTKPVPTAPLEPPDWLFPIDLEALRAAAKTPTPPKLDDVEKLTIPDSKESFTLARINDKFNPPDWRPASHTPMPEVVAHGRKPNVWACAYCHTPSGQGRPENSALAGLPEAYLRQQLIDFRSGARKPYGPEKYAPSRDMHKLAKSLTDTDIDESAKYFSQQKLKRRVYVVESLRIPRAEPAFWIYKEWGGTEDLGDRMLEVATEIERHERRDDRLEYMAYVPPGSLTRGKKLVVLNEGKKTVVCSSCHGATLRGMNDVPAIAGRPPSYLLRQMLAFKSGIRTNSQAAQMTPVVEKLELNEMIDVVAYVSSLYP